MEFPKEILNMSVRDMISAASQKRAGEIRRNSDGNLVKVVRLTLDLTTARTAQNPYPINFAFQSVRVETATDSSTNVLVSFGSPSLIQTDNYVKMIVNDSLNMDDTINSANLVWSAQSGKSITLLFFLDIKFQSGSQISVNSGGVSINDGSAFSTALVTLLTATATQIFSSNTSRKTGTFVNDSTGTIWVGGSSVADSGANKGIPVLAGQSFVWRNTAALYGYHSAGYSQLATMEET
jgi:hypothetical protein